MKTPRCPRIVMLCLLLALAVPLSIHLTARPAHAAGNVYYVDEDNGSDSCDGLYYLNNGKDCPWKTVAPVNSMTFQPGDTIAFKDGDIWTDMQHLNTYYLHPLGSGTSAAPIIITDYCPSTGQLGGCSNNPLPYPILNGNGDGSAIGSAGNAGGTLYLFNQSYWNISHLEIQNTCSSCPQTYYRQGILIQADNAGQVSGITLQNLTVDQVLGELYFSLESKRTGGIIFDIEGPTTPATPTYFSGVTVTNVTVHDVARSGIYFYSVWKGPVMGNPCPQQQDDGYTANQWVPSTYVTVSYNTVYNIQGDGIVVTDASKQMIDNNVVHDTHQDSGSSAGIWTEDSYQATIEDNEVYNVKFNGGDNDAEAFDTDRCDIGAIFQYNYSHENDGGFLLTIQWSADTIVRYNISQNDGNSTQKNPRFFLMNNTAGGLQVYDNDIFSNLDTYPYQVGLIASSTLSYTNYPQPFFENNLVFNQNPAGVCYINTPPGSNPWYVSNNDLYGYGSQQCSYGTAITGNPDFTIPPAGIGRVSAITAYTLSPGSPAFCQGAAQGTPIQSNGGYDFAGTSLPSGSVDAGALEKGKNIC